MAGFDDEKTDPNGPSPNGPSPNGPSPSGPPELIPQAETAEDDFYAVAEPEPDSPAPGAGVTTPEWYVTVAGGQKDGPMGLMELQQRVASGSLRADMLVWRSGMPDWIPAGGVPELFDPSAPPPVPPPGGPFGSSSADAAAKAAEMLGWLDGLFASPTVYRITGRVCAALGAVILLVAMVLLPFNLAGSAISLTVALLCALIFLIGEAAGAILHVLGRIESQSAPPPQSDDPPS